jgi:hypothetical protein
LVLEEDDDGTSTKINWYWYQVGTVPTKPNFWRSWFARANAKLKAFFESHQNGNPKVEKTEHNPNARFKKSVATEECDYGADTNSNGADTNWIWCRTKMVSHQSNNTCGVGELRFRGEKRFWQNIFESHQKAGPICTTS